MNGGGFMLTTKQGEVMEAIRTAPITGIEEIFLIGPIGSTKTFVMAVAHINVCNTFAGSIIPVGRKNAAEHSIGTFAVYREALEKMGLRDGKHYHTREATNDMQIRFPNGSLIKFIGMNRSIDRQWSKLKISSTMAGVDEVDDVEESGYDMLFSRTGRKNDTGAPRVMVSCCNPNEAWTKTNIYLPWLKRIGRRPVNVSDEEWDRVKPLGRNKMVIEFEMHDSPLFGTGYYDRFMERPLNWRKRFLNNDWFYQDDENSLFKSRTMNQLTIQELKRGKKYIAVDPNAGGKDRASICLWEGDTIVEFAVYTTEELMKKAKPEELNPYNPGAVIGRLTIEMAVRESVGARDIVGDVVGIGQGWLTYMLSNGYKAVRQFRSGDAPVQTAEEREKKIKPPYFDLRSQMFALWALDMDNGRVFFYSDCPHLATLKKELQLHEGDATSKVMRVTPKDEMKALLGGGSPDVADSAMMGYYLRYINQKDASLGAGVATVGKTFDDLYNQGNAY